jgi:hypothetical protein
MCTEIWVVDSSKNFRSASKAASAEKKTKEVMMSEKSRKS